MKKFKRWEEVGNKIIEMILFVFGVIMVVLLSVNGIGRYFFGRCITSSQEITRILFVWGCFIGITVAFVKDLHIGFDVIKKWNKVTEIISNLVNNAVLFVVGFVVVKYGRKFILITGKYPLPALKLPISCLYYAGVVTGVFWMIIAVYKFYKTMRLITVRKEETR